MVELARYTVSLAGILLLGTVGTLYLISALAALARVWRARRDYRSR